MSVASDIVERIDSIGTVPTAVAQVFGLINDPRSTMADFERVVRPDVGLTANLLRSANSAFYRGSREITSVRDAITRMGMRRVFELAAGGAFAKAIPAFLNGYGTDAETYWGHSVAVAVLADRIGREAGFTYPDLAFTAGLLHDLGKVVVSSWLEASATVRVPPGSLISTEAEVELLGASHAEFGEALCAKWNLPKDIGGASRWHHSPGDAPTATLRYLSSVIRVADGAAHAAGFGEGHASEPLDAESLERLSLTADRVTTLLETVTPEIERTRQLLAAATQGMARAA